MRQRPPSMPHVHPVKGHAPPLSQLVHDPSIKGFKLSARRTTLNVALALLVAWLCLIGPHLRPRSPALAQQPGLEIHQPPPRSNNGLTTEVEWDRYSLFVKGQRLFIYSGEIHPWRLPSPPLWQDLTEKVKAAGMNAVSIYVFWGIVNPKRGVTDWTGYRDLQPFLDHCKRSGLYVVIRPGPHIQAEVTAGGIAPWALNIEGELRTNASDYTAAWTQYVEEVSEITRRNQVTEGGPIVAMQVENEYYQRLPKRSNESGNGGRNVPREYHWGGIAHMELLKATFKKAGVVVPLTFNDVGFRDNYASGPGAVDIYGWDGYPQGFDCANPSHWEPLPSKWHEDHMRIDPERPSYSPEFQGGAFDPWSGVGYDKCERLTGAEFARVFYVGGLWAANVKMVSFYMIYGGTSWGQMPFPGVYTSYDYGAAIREDRTHGDKFSELKLQGLFLRNAPFAHTDFIADSLKDRSLSTNPDVLTVHLRNPETNTGFYLARHANSSSLETTSFALKVDSSAGTIDVEDVHLWGRDARMIVTDYSFGTSKILFTTGSIMLSTTIDGQDLIILHGHKGDRLQIAIPGAREAQVHGSALTETALSDQGSLMLSTVLPLESSTTAIQISDGPIVLMADTAAAATFWQPVIASDREDGNYFRTGTNETVLVAGPHLVRSASYSGSTLYITGDLVESTILLAYAPRHISFLNFNGAAVSASRNAWGALEGPVQFAAVPPNLPKLLDWRYRDSLPEILDNFDDSRWTRADKTHTVNPFWSGSSNNSGPWVLFGQDYGYHQGNLLWRGSFDSTSVSKVKLEVAGGWGSGFSAWLNGRHLGSVQSLSSDKDELSKTFHVDSTVLRDEANILTVLQDHSGYLNDGTLGGFNKDFKKPRGIMKYQLFDEAGLQLNFSTWKVAGSLGGEDYLDRTRGNLNEGGLFGERAGWHLPGFNDSDWERRSPQDGNPAPGVGFYRTSFDLAIPASTDAPISLRFSPDRKAYRVQVYINGWQLGKLHSAAGPQYSFPLHPGILVTNGRNELVLSVWSLDGDALRIGDVWLKGGAVVQGGIGHVESDNPRWEERDVY